jgi:fumarate reductase subunit D
MGLRGNTRIIISRRIIDYKIVNTAMPHPFTIITLGLFLYVGSALYLDIGMVSKTTFRIHYWTVPLILTLITIDILLLAFRFHRLLRVLNFNTPMRSILIYFIGLSFTITEQIGSRQISSIQKGSR